MKSDMLWRADLGDGTYRNPVLFADYSDPDAICVDGVYYMVASSFNYTPGLPILISRDLVNWELVNYALPAIPEARYALPCHSDGVWAPAIRYHEGVFYILYGMPDEGIFSVRSRDPLGAWEAPVCLLAGKGLIDPCPFWDADGNAYVVHGYARSRIGFKSFLGIFPMDEEATHATGADHLLYSGLQTQPTIEGPKVYQRGEYIYIFAPAGGVDQGWQTVLRSRSIHGPFEERVVMRQGHSPVNGPHQGAWVVTPYSEDWFLHFQSLGAYGRVVHLQPMRWTEDSWPYIGVDEGDSEWGVPCATHTKPISDGEIPPVSLQASDDFTGSSLALQWQFLGNMPCNAYALEAGTLRLNALALPEGGAPILWRCPQALTEKLVCPAFEATVHLDFSALNADEQVGLALMGGQYAYVVVRRSKDGLASIVAARSHGDGATRKELVNATLLLPQDISALTLRMTLGGSLAQPEARFSYSHDGSSFIPVGEPFLPARHTWVGAKPTLFAMSLSAHESTGFARFQNFMVRALNE